MARILDLDKKYKSIIFLLLIVFFLIIFVAIIFSKGKDLFSDKGTVAVVVNEGDLVINYIDGETINFFDNKEHNYGISITNNGQEKVYYSIYLEDVNISNVKIDVKDEKGTVIKDTSSNVVDEKLVNLYSLDAQKTVRFQIIVSPKDTVNFKGKLRVENESMSTNSFDDLILLNNYIVAPQSRVGNEIAILDEGLIQTNDNKGVSYYFRGNVLNNYVSLGNLLFRIVRINGDRTVRLVLNDVLENQYAYNNVATGEEDKNPAILNNSSLSEILNNWVKENLSDYDSYLAMGDYCTDTTFNYTLNNNNYSKTYERVFADMAPDLYCNGELYSSKVGLLSIDEVVLAGAYKNMVNDNYYLYNKDISGSYLTTSTFAINEAGIISMMNVMSNGALGDGIFINNLSYIRPVVNISINAKVKGKGTIDNPYMIVS